MTRRNFLWTALAAGSLTRSGLAQAFSKTVGVTVLPEYIQSEGIEGVLSNLMQRCGATAVTTSPYVMAEADPDSGEREPPADAGAGSVRLLDRPLWGKKEVWVRTAPSFAPRRELYEGLRYQPPAPNRLTSEEGPLIQDFIRAAKGKGLKVYLQIQAAIPPGYRVQFGGPEEEDRPRLPDGTLPSKRLAKNGSLASPHILGYTQALIRDLIQAYPELDGLRFDWPEYPPYFLDSVFLDFGRQAQAAAARLGFDFAGMKRDTGALYNKLHGGLTDSELIRWTEDGREYGILAALAEYPAVLAALRFKAALVSHMLKGYREAMDEAAGGRMELLANAFPPPWSLVSGMDYRQVGSVSDGMLVKLYTMHWPMILRFYADQLLEANPGLSSRLLKNFLLVWLDIADGEGLKQLEDYHYPEPEEVHPVSARAQARKIEQAQSRAGQAPVYSLAHGYGPLQDFKNRLGVAWQASSHGLWVNRYAYLSNDKLDAIGRVTRSNSAGI